MSNYKGVTIVAKADQVPPIKLLKAVWDNNQSCLGIAVVAPAEDNQNFELLTGYYDKADDFEKVVKFFDVNKGSPKAMFLGSFPENYDKESIPPFNVLVSSEGEDQAIWGVVFPSGSFAGYSKPESSHSEQWHAARDYIRQKITEAFNSKDVDGDMEALEKKIGGSAFEKEMLSTISSHGSIVLMFDNGLAKVYQKGDLGGDYDWGYISHLASDVEKALAEGKEPPAPKATKRRAATLDGSNPNDAKETITVEQKTIKADNNPQNTTALTATATQYVTIECPQHIRGASAVRDFYDQFVETGIIEKRPNDYKNKPKITVPVPTSMTMKSFKEAAATMKLLDIVKKSDPPLTEEEIKKARAATLIPVDEKKVLVDQVLPKIIDMAGKAGKTPEEIWAEEEEFPTFQDHAGMESLDDLMGWSQEQRRVLTSKCPSASALLIGQLLRTIRELMDDEDEVDEATTKAAEAQAEAEEAAKAAAGGNKRRAVL